MNLQTSRFGNLEVDDQRIITFPKGLLGFPRFTRYVLLEQAQDAHFFWLQSCDTPDLAFVVTDPALFVPSYKVPIKKDEMLEIGIDEVNDAQVLVIVNKRGDLLTGNLQGPLVVHLSSRIGAQLVLSDRRFTTRVPLLEIGSTVEAMSA